MHRGKTFCRELSAVKAAREFSLPLEITSGRKASPCFRKFLFPREQKLAETNIRKGISEKQKSAHCLPQILRQVYLNLYAAVIFMPNAPRRKIS